MLKRILQSLGFAILLLITSFAELLGTLKNAAFHSSLAAPTVLVASLLNIFLLTVLCFAALTWLERHTDWPRTRLILIVVVPVILLTFNRLLVKAIWIRIFRQVREMHYKQLLPHVLGEPLPYALVLAFGVAWAILVYLIWKYSPRLLAILLAVARIAALSTGVLGLVMLADLLLAGVRRAGDSDFAPAHVQSAAEHAAKPRIVWIVLDELSYKQAFESRIPDLQLPNMDRLRAESDLYTNARPIGFYTDLVLPGMLLGEELSWFRFTLPNNIAYVYTRDKQYHPWDPGQTVLGDAERANFNVGLVGWWNPYCTMFSGMLQQCFWSSSTPYNPMRPWYGVGKNMLVPYTERLITSSAPPLLGVHANDTLTLLDHAKADLANDQLDFVMVHLGTPHHPYVFDRHTGKLSIRPGHSYQDGLAMADWALGQMLDVIQSDPRWSRTTVIVQGDHSWRTAIWTTEPGWTGEDEKTSNHETFDDRPALLVHSPGQTTPGTIAAPTSLLQVHTMLESAIHTGAPTTAH